VKVNSIPSVLPRIAQAPALEWVPVIIGLTALFVPTYLRLWQGLWQQEEYGHGPIIVAVFWWLVWRQRAALAGGNGTRAPWLGGAVLLSGLLLYYVGRSQNLPLFEVTAQIPILAGLVLALAGWTAFRALWFPFVFLLFLIPLPGFVMVGITGHLKQVVSQVAEALLYRAGYPVARDGVVITVGQYQMLVADACSGLNSMYSLSAMGLLYIYLMRHASRLRNAILLATIIPIAFTANVLRVIMLILLTYHFGDEVGQGFLHNASGVFLFVAGLVVMAAIDLTMGRLVFDRTSSRGKHVQ
jgi:exosortase B